MANLLSPPALLLVGGLGTRLRELYPDRPKALVPVCGRPFIAWQIEGLQRQGITRIHLAAGYRGDALADWVRAQPAGELQLTVSVEPAQLGTGGGLRYASDHLTGERLLVLNGDSLAPGGRVQRLEEALAADANAWMSLAVAPIEDAGRYGSVDFEADGRVTAFREKAERSQGWINAGVYLLERRVLDLIPADRPSSLETEVFPALAAAGRLRAVTIAPPLLDMGTADGLRAMEAWITGRG